MKNGAIVAEGNSTDVLTKEILSDAYGCEINVHEIANKKIISL